MDKLVRQDELLQSEQQDSQSHVINVLNNTLMPIYVFYATPKHVYQIALHVPLNASLKAALQISLTFDGYPERHAFYQRIPNFSLEKGVFGVFGKIKTLDALLKPDDRIEIYRPLIANPMDARRRRVTKIAKVNVRN